MPEIILGDLELHYTEAGHGSPLLLLHGSFSTGADAFGEILPLLAAHCHVLCPDMRGHGATRAAPYGWTVPQLARDMLAFLDALGISRASVAGHSMGGDVVMYMAVLSHCRVEKLVSIGSAGIPGPSVSRFVQRFSPEAHPEKAFPRFVQAIKEKHMPAHGGDWRTFARTTIENCCLYPQFSEDDFRSLDMPFLLLCGSRDRLTPPEDREKLQSLCPRFTQHAVPGAGHAPSAAPPCRTRPVSSLTFWETAVSPKNMAFTRNNQAAIQFCYLYLRER